jgi:hypothetical protein
VTAIAGIDVLTVKVIMLESVKNVLVDLLQLVK